MQPELLNLLPPERARATTRQYFIRLAVVAIITLAVVLIASGALLVPAYLSTTQDIADKQARSDELAAELATTKGKETNQRLAALSESATYLSRLATTTTATGALQAVLAVPRPGITLSGFTYSPPLQKGNGKMTLKGKAMSREALRAFDRALSALPFVSTVDLPISVYAKETDIDFTITLTGTLLP